MRKRVVWALALLPMALPVAAVALATLTADPSSLSFPARCVRTSAPTRSVTITNGGNRSADDVTVTISPSSFSSLFPLSGTTADPQVQEGESISFSVGFVPATAGEQSAHARIDYTSTQAASSENPSPKAQAKSTSVPVAGDGIDRFLDLSPRLVVWGETRTGTRAGGKTVTVFDDGDSPLSITRIRIRGSHAADFSVSPTANATVTDGSPLKLTVGFRPRATGARTARLEVTSNACTDPVQSVDLQGIGVAPDIIALPGRLDFGARVVGDNDTRDLSIANQGGASLRVDSIKVRGADPGQFRAIGVPTLPTRLAPGEAIDLRVRFRPRDLGERKARIVVRSSDSTDGGILRVRLTGEVTDVPPTPTPSPTPSPTLTPTPTPTQRPVAGRSLGDFTGELLIAAAVVVFFVGLGVLRRVRRARTGDQD